MNRAILLVLVASSIACRTGEGRIAAEQLSLEEQDAEYAAQMDKVEGGFRGDAATLGSTDELGFDGANMTMVVQLLSRRDGMGTLDISLRPGMGNWMVGRGDVSLQEIGAGQVEAHLSDGRSLGCDLIGDWSPDEGLVDAELDCEGYDGRLGRYVFTAGRF